MARKKVEAVEENADVAASIDFENNDDLTPVDDNIAVEVDIANAEANEVEAHPRMTDPGWTQWVLSQFEPNELEEGLPKVDGLKRMVRKLIGPIVKGKSETKQVPTIENEQRATVEYTIVVLNKYNLEDFEEPYLQEFTDVADAYLGNIKGMAYARFPTAMASTRAQVRALRNALNFGLVGSEEISDQPLEEAGFSSDISESQITKIDIKCQQLNINVMKFINMGKTKYKSIDEVPSVKAVKMFLRLNEYQQEIIPVPDSISGYDPKWRSEV